MTMTMSELCDEILKLCYQAPDQVTATTFSFPQAYTAKGVPEVRTRGALRHLEKAGYLENLYGDHPGGYVLTAEGELFWEQGGYDGQRKRDLADRQLQAEVSQSSIRTDNSVQQTNSFQRPMARNTFLVLIFASFVSVANLVVGVIPRSDQSQAQRLIESLTQGQLHMQRTIDSLHTLVNKPVSTIRQAKVGR